MKKLLLFLLLTLSCSCIMAGLSACGSENSDITYSLSNRGEYYIVSSIDESCTEIEIPSEYKGLPVKQFGNYAFKNCTSLKSITFGENISSYTKGSFEYCTALENIYVASGNTTYSSIDGNLYSYDGSTFMQYAFGKTATSFTIPDGVTTIGDSAFSHCASLTSITIPDSVTSIEYSAFYGCTSLESVTIPDSVTEIGQHAFNSCAIESLSIGKGVETIGYEAFYNCTSLKEVYYNAVSVEESYENSYLFSYAGNDSTGLTVTIGNCVETIPDYLFWVGYVTGGLGTTYYTNNIKNIIFEEGSVCSTIGESSFNGNFITSLSIPNSVQTIKVYAFYGCEDLETIELGIGLTKIGQSAFCHCSSLKSVTIPINVNYIGKYAFAACESLESITFGSTSRWFVTSYYQTSNITGKSIDVTDTSKNVTYFSETYEEYYWYRSEN